MANPTYTPGDDIKPIHKLFHKFIVHPILSRIDAMIAFELADISIKTHMLVSLSYLTILQMHDLVLFKHPTWEPSHDYFLGIVRKVTLPIYLHLHGKVDISQNEDSCFNKSP
jgi:hypothetical protein